MENAAPAKVFFAGENGGVKTALDLAAQAGTVTLVTDMAQAERAGAGWRHPAGRSGAGAGRRRRGVDPGRGRDERAGVRAARPAGDAYRGGGRRQPGRRQGGQRCAADRDRLERRAAGAGTPGAQRVGCRGADPRLGLRIRRRRAPGHRRADLRPHRGPLGQGESSNPGMGLLQLSDLSSGGARGGRARFRLPITRPRRFRMHRPQGAVCFLAAELLFFFIIFGVVRRYSLRHPEALDSLVADKTKF